MPDSVILRYRDLGTLNAVSDHRAVITSAGYTWWGWWKKDNEADQLKTIEELKAKTSKGSIPIGIFNKATTKFYVAQLADCIGSTVPVASPEIPRTPSYYAQARLPGWFKLTSIDEVAEADFIKQFSDVPAGDGTFFPVWYGQTTRDSYIPDWINVRSSTLLHISDVHFGSDFAFPSKEGPGAVPLIDVIGHDTAESFPGIVIISGDMTTRADANVLFNEGLTFLNSLASRLNLSPDQVILVPGNHDIPLNKFSPHDYSHENAFRAFMQEFYRRRVEYPDLRRFILKNGRRLELLAINSVRLRRESEKNFGYVQWPIYEDRLKAVPYDPETFRIAVLHHHLVPAVREEVPDTTYPEASISVTLDAGAVIAGLQRHHFQIALHGHQHVPSATRLARGILTDGSPELDGLGASLTVIAAGSAGANRLSDEMRDNSYNIIRFSEKKVDIEARQYNPGSSPRTHFRFTM
jgi:predicted phosphodiesterase